MNNHTAVPSGSGDPTAVRAYMALIEARMGTAFLADGLYVHLAGSVQGPHTITVSIRL